MPARQSLRQKSSIFDTSLYTREAIRCGGEGPMSTRKGQAASVTLLRREQLRSASAPTKSIVDSPTSIRRKSRARLWSIEGVRGNHPKVFPGLFSFARRFLFGEAKENAVRFPFPGKSKQRKQCGHQTGSEFLKIPPAGEKTRKKRGKFQIISRISLAFSAKGWYNPIILIV